jgi:glutamate carboxypeptidase
MLQKLGFKEYGQLTVLINGDEEISSPGSRALISKLASEHDAVLSHEGASATEDKLSLATAGIGAVSLKVQGKASHAGSAPERGVNAFYEMAHQVLQMRDLSDPATGLKMNWTVGQAGNNRNVIPASATAMADVRVTKVADYDRVEREIGERVKKQLIPDAKVDIKFERRRPPLESSPASLAMAKHAQGIFGEIDLKLGADDKVAGGGTDAAFAGLSGKAAVVERFGLQGFGAHSADAEYVLVDSIEPRLYLVTRMVIDIARGKVPAQCRSPR